jgi:hypothetical protein
MAPTLKAKAGGRYKFKTNGKYAHPAKAGWPVEIQKQE